MILRVFRSTIFCLMFAASALVFAGAADDRQSAIVEDLRRLDELKTAHGGSFAQWQNEMLPIYTEYNNFARKTICGWWLGDTFCKPIPFYVQPVGNRDFNRRLIDYNNYLKSCGIDLIVVRMPLKADFSFSMFNRDKSVYPNPLWLALFDELLTNNIEVIDVLPDMIDEASSYPLIYDYINLRNSNPEEGAAMIAAKATATRLESYNLSSVGGALSSARVKNLNAGNRDW
ncbi:MAG: hypothetical protein PHI35_05140, partial [Victivallaceae bacterium]|nr:hypothetical protein [Victivallaceae bacterium]